MMKKYRYPLLAFLLLAIAGGWYFTKPKNEKVTYRLATLDRGAIIAGVTATGAITPLSTVIVGSQLSGQIIEIKADYNSEVEEGQVLARLDATQIKARLDGARADLAQIKAQRVVQLATIEKVKADQGRISAVIQDMTAQFNRAEGVYLDAEKTFKRQEDLQKGGFVSQSVFDTAKTALNTAKQAKESALAQQASSRAQELTSKADLKVSEAMILTLDAQILQKDAAVRALEVDVANTDIKSSVKGVVVQRQVELGQSVAASLQSPTLFLVAKDLREMEILANVDESDVGRIKPSQKVTFTVNAYPSETFEGQVKLVRLGAQTVQNVVIYTTVISFRNNEQKLKPGMTATLRVITEERANVMRLPNAVLRWRPVIATAATVTTPTIPLAAPPQAQTQRPQQGGGGRIMQELIAAIKTEGKLTPKQSEELERILREKRGDFQGLQGVQDQATRADRFRVIRNSIFDELNLSLEASQKESLNALRERLDVRTGGTVARVYLLNDKGEPEAKTVRLGATDGAFTEIISGLRESDKPIMGSR